MYSCHNNILYVYHILLSLFTIIGVIVLSISLIKYNFYCNYYVISEYIIYRT